MGTANTAPHIAVASTPRAGVPRHELTGPADAPVVLVLGGISADAHVSSSAHDAAPGWWEPIVGDGRALDTTRVRVLGVDWLGATHGVVTTGDQAAAIVRLLDHLGVDRLHAAIGASYGGMVVLALAERFPERVERLVVISAAHESHPMTTGLRAIQRRIVRLGIDTGRGAEALAIARALAMTTYRTANELADRFAPVVPEPADAGGAIFAVERYLMHHGERFAARFDARRFLALSLSGDLHRVDPSRITTPALLVAADGDTLVPRAQMETLARALAGPSTLAELSSRVGHDAFLTEPAQVSALLGNFLDLQVTA